MPVPTMDPITVDGESLDPVTFSGLTITVESDQRLGFHHEGAGMARAHDYRWGPNFAEETHEVSHDVIERLEQAGYRTVTWGPDGIPPSDTGTRVVRLRGTLDIMEFNSFTISGGYYQTYCEINWEVTDLQGGPPIFTTRTIGYHREAEHAPGIILKAFHSALFNLLAQEEFVAAVEGE